MAYLFSEALLVAVNKDPEFRLAARYWNGIVKFTMGPRVYLLILKDGELHEVIRDPGMMNDWDFDLYIQAPADEWQKLLEAVPKPFYQAILPASIYHGFSLGGDFTSFCAYYRALSRLVELMRGHAVFEKEV